MKLTLASGSPRRAKILETLGVPFEIVKTDAPEKAYPSDPERTVRENALAKGEACRRENPNRRHVLSADTIVWYGGKIYGKPCDLDEAAEFLRTLSGRTHTVFTGVAFDGEVKVAKSAVRFRRLSERKIAEYVGRVKPTDRAGAYDIDESGDLIVAGYDGEYENIMGLPVKPLEEWGIVPRRAKVGFFDSGVGGRSILEAFQKLAPGVETEYVADSRHFPYGNRSAEEIISLSRACTEKLLKKGCDVITVACNTATGAAIDTLRREYPEVPFVGIEPAIKPAALKSKTGVVAVLATAGTFNGRLYRETKARFAKDVTVLATVADEFVEIVEGLKGRKIVSLKAADQSHIQEIVRRRVEPLIRAGADRIVLGCTHFPHLQEVIERVADGRAEVIDPSDAVARQILRVIAAKGLRI